MLRILGDTCVLLKEYIRQKEYHLSNTTMLVVGNEIRYEIARAQAKLDHYIKMYKEVEKYGFIDKSDREEMEIELDEKLEKIETCYRGEPEEKYTSVLDDFFEDEEY